MAKTVRYIGMVVVVAAAALSPAWAVRVRSAPSQESTTGQTASFAGSDLFRSYCATCHGTGGKGDGPLAEMLKKRPADLTLFARANNGTYPAEMVGRIIDGRQPLAGHGGKDMPIWGDAFRESGGGSDEAAVKARIDALARHLETLQVK
jgi:mono/diheme cytochrome c family protein